MLTNTFIIQAYDPIMSEYFWIWFIDYMFMDKSLTNHTNLFSPYDFEKVTK